MIRLAQAYAARKPYQQIAPVLNEQSPRRYVALEARPWDVAASVLWRA
jgi:hypothetical protein